MTLKNYFKVVFNILLICFVYLCNACGIHYDTELTGRCYVYSGLYLVYGDEDYAGKIFDKVKADWPYAGYVEDVFYTYNEDPTIDIYIENDVSYEEAEKLAQDYRVVVIYKQENGEYHSVPFSDFDEIDKHIVQIVVCYTVDDGENNENKKT